MDKSNDEIPVPASGPSGIPGRLQNIRLRLSDSLHYLTPLKIANIGLIHLQKALKTEYVVGRPYGVMIEPTNICNANCQLCPTGQGHFARPKGKLEWDEYKKLIDEWSRWMYRLRLSLWGEPMLAPDIYRMIEYAHRARIWTCISSNLHAFHPGNGDDVALIESGLDQMTCSLHAASQETYENYQPGRKFEANVNKIRQLIQTRERMRSKTPRLVMNFVVTRFNEHEVQKFKDLTYSLGCRPKITEPSLNLRFLVAGQTPAERDDEVNALAAKWLPASDKYTIEPYRMLRDKSIRLDDFGKQFNGAKMFPCPCPWTGMVISWDGGVALCSTRSASEDMGNVQTASLAEIWNSPRYRASRRSFKHPTDLDVPCASCSGLLL
jgi:radical SAM protein with 4Fe4S-binding SPASM domain